MARDVIDRTGRWDVLVNNAGHVARGTLETTDAATWDAVFKGCVISTWLCMRAALPHMRAAGAGRIVNLSSIVGLGADSTNILAYATAKTAIIGLSLAAARELGPQGITVNVIAPGTVETDQFQRFPDPEEEREKRSRKAVMGRLAQPSEIGRAIAFLVSPESGFITGQVLAVDGGRIDKM